MTSAPSVCPNVIFLGKILFLNVGPKLSYLDIFRLELEKVTVLWYFTSLPSNFLNTKFRLKIKILIVATKIALNAYFGLEFQSFIQKQKNFKLGTKVFISTSNYNIKHQNFNSTLEFVKLLSFILNDKNKFGTKNALFLSLAWNLKNLLSYL